MRPFKVSKLLPRSDFPSKSVTRKAIQATGFKNPELALVDLARFASVSAFADTFIRDKAQIDILVYNAAVSVTRYSASNDGWEET